MVSYRLCENFCVALLGGGWDFGSACGAFALSVYGASSARGRLVGGRLLYVHI